MTNEGNATLSQFGGGSPDVTDEVVEEARHVTQGDEVTELVDLSEHRFPDADGTVELAVTQVDYTVEGAGDDEYPVLHVFGRTPDRTVEHVRVFDFEPYFYTPVADLAHEAPDDRPLRESDFVDDRLMEERITGVQTRGDRKPSLDAPDADEVVLYESIRGEKLVKVFGQTPRDVGQLRDRFDHFEADILFPNRLLIDKDITSGVRVPAQRAGDGTLKVHHEQLSPVDLDVEPRVHTFDIEVDDRAGFPEDGEEPIICMTGHDAYRDEYVVWLYDAPGAAVEAPEKLDGFEFWNDGSDATVELRVFDTEEAMHEDYLEYLDERDPDVLTGWNCLPEDSSIQLADGTEREIQDVEIGDRVVGSEGQQTTTAEVTNKWRSEKRIHEFELADGTSLRSSADHRIMVGDDDAVDWKRGRNISAGDFVLKPRKLTVDAPTIPTLSDLVPVECQRFPDASAVESFKQELPYGAVTQPADEFGLATGTPHHQAPDVWTPKRCRPAAERFDIPLPDGGRVYRRDGPMLDRQLTEHELYLAGLITADGTMSEEDGVRFYNTREELHDQFPGENEFTADGTGSYKQNVLDYARLHAFNGLGIPFGDKNAVDIDLSRIYQMPERYIAAFLAGVVDGDGSINRSVSVAAENRSLGEWYVKLFKRLGIYARQREHVVRVPDSERELARVRDSILPWMHHSEKVRALSELEGGQSGRSENIPYALFETEAGTDERRIGNDKHRRNINLKRHDTLSDEWSEYVFIEVDATSVAETETTYDLETTTHNFVADGCLVHNCDDFDFPYYVARLDELGLDSDRLSRVDEVWDSGWGGPNIKGRVVFDLLYAYERRQYSELDSYRLDAVAEQELDAGKERYTGDIGDLWEQDPERLLEYNLRDVELCVEIDRKVDLVSFWSEVASFVGCKLEDATTPGDAVDLYILHKVHGDFALPSKGTVESEEYEGGAVFDPISGVRENVTVLDLKSLYPMCMVTTNASPETKVDPETYDGETFRAPNGTHFRKEPDGIIREMVDELLTERENKKAARDEHDPGSPAYERFDSQQAAVKVIMNCFTPDTDVLTPAGVRNIRELEVGDPVYSLDPETMEMEVKPVVETHAYPDYRGELVDIETSKIDFRVTPNHRMLVRKDESNGVSWDGYRFVEAGDLDDASNYQLPHDWQGPDGEELDRVDLTKLLDGEFEVWANNDVHGHSLAAEVGWYPDKVVRQAVNDTGYVFSAAEFDDHREYLDESCSDFYLHGERGRKWIPRFYDGDDFLELLAWYITEGSVYSSEDKQFGEHFRGSSTTVNIAQDALADGGDRGDHAAIGDLLNRMGFDPYVNEKGYQFTSRLLGEWLEGSCGADSFEKRVPEFVFGLPSRQKRLFLETLIAGDGDRQPNSWRYSTASERLRDDVLRLCAHLGLTANYNEDSGTYRVYVTEGSKNTLRMHRSAERSTAEDGVYCVTVGDNHTLLAGRNGRFQFVGQSLYGVLGWDRFRLYDKEMGAAVTATGREVIEYTDEVVANEGYEVVYGDTDSVMLQLGDITADDVDGDVEVTDGMREKHPEMADDELETIAATIRKGFELEEIINDSYDDFALERLNAEFHRFQIEFEKLYRRFFQAGKKKRYAGHIVWKEGKDVDDIDITGFEYKRSDIAPITKEVQKTVLEMIVKDGDVEGVKEYVHDVIEEFQRGERPLDDIGIPGGIGKKLDAYDTDTAQVRGAKYANLLLGTNIQRGSKPKRLYLEKVHPDFWERVEAERGLDPQSDPLYGEFKRDPDVICFEYADEVPEAFQVDWDKMLEKTLRGPIARVLEALDVSWEEVRDGQEQTGLSQYF